MISYKCFVYVVCAFERENKYHVNIILRLFTYEHVTIGK